MSKGSVSREWTFLCQIEAVKIMERSNRREFFWPELGLRGLARRLLQGKVKSLTAETRVMVGKLRRQAGVGDDGHVKFRNERSWQQEAWSRQRSRGLPAMRGILSITSR